MPMSTRDLAITAQECAKAGAAGIHLHVRDATGAHSLDPSRYAEAIWAIAETAPSLEIQISTEAAGVFSVTDQKRCLDALRPASASLSIREMARDPKTAQSVYAIAQETRTKLQHILYDAQDIALLDQWIGSGTIPASNLDVLCVLGRYSTGQTANPTDLQAFLPITKRRKVTWSVCAFGHHEQACLMAALRQGANLRVGFENNRHLPGGELLRDNATSVANIVKAAKNLGYAPQRIAS